VSEEVASEVDGVAEGWLNRGVAGIGSASFLADVGHEIPTALLPALLTSTLGASASALGVIEGLSDGLAGAARFAGGALADDPGRRRRVAVAGYTSTAVLAAATGAATAVWQVGVLRAAAWTARGLRVPARNALLADIVSPSAYGRAYGFERTMDNLGAVFGPLLALVLVAAVGTRTAIGLSVIPGVLAALAIIYAIKHTTAPAQREKVKLRFHVRPVLRGDLGGIIAATALFETGNAAATLFILRASTQLSPSHGTDAATQIALALYVAYNAAATIASFPAGRLADRLGDRGPVIVLLIGVILFGVAYATLAVNSASILFLALPFLAAGVAIGAVETAEHSAVAALAPNTLRGSAFGMLATVQAIGNFAASAIAGLIWTIISPTAAFLYLTAWMLLATVALSVLARRKVTA
jgi:MFS family permease